MRKRAAMNHFRMMSGWKKKEWKTMNFKIGGCKNYNEERGELTAWNGLREENRG